MKCAYSALAKQYDNLMGDFDYNGYVAFVDDRLSGQGIDLCCGTGKFTIELARRGRKMIGVDASTEMLNVARDNARKAGCNLPWIASDVRTFHPGKAVDFVTCFCDGFNYLPPKDLRATLRAVAGYVRQGGTLVFDVSSEHKLRDILGDNFFYEDTDSLTYLWTNEYDARLMCVHMQLTLFTPSGADGMYRREDETHTQYVHTHEAVAEALQADWDWEVYDGESYGAFTPESRRALYVCKRK